jgi:V/A-type H+-transporting ATPase subunit I
MYGLPSYGEIDPTPLVAFTYSLFFGLMFGDVGQGAVISLIGFLLCRYKKMALGAVLAIVGLVSVFFGFMYGSVFGFENIIEAKLIRPFEDVMTMLYFAVGLGIVVMFVCMCCHIINSLKKRDTGDLLFNPNGIAGVALYGLAVAFVLIILLAGIQIPLTVILISILIPLILVTFKEPLGERVNKLKEKLKLTKKKKRGSRHKYRSKGRYKSKSAHGSYAPIYKADDEEIKNKNKEGSDEKKKEKQQSLPMYLFITLMELVEVILAYFSNTLSFVRIAGYAISHAGIMSAVMLLSGANNGNPNIFGVILGNIVVMGLEGLVVFIQTMRLQYYEMFSRYYEGGGKEFVAYKNINN